MPASHIRGGQQTTMRLQVIADAFGDRAFVKIIARRHQGRVPAMNAVAFLSCRDRAQRAGKVGLDKDIADFGHLAVRQKDALRGGPLGKDRSTSRDVLDAQLVNRKAIREFNRRLHNFGQRFRAETI